MKDYHIEFMYNERGRGVLVIKQHSLLIRTVEARTGSINSKGDLVNAIKKGRWYIIEQSVDTDEKGMIITPGKGWKVRLWLLGKNNTFQFTHFLIHPDGDGTGKGKLLNGTKGCIGTQKDALDVRKAIDNILKRQKSITVFVNVPVTNDEVIS